MDATEKVLKVYCNRCSNAFLEPWEKGAPIFHWTLKKKSNLASKREECVNQPREEKITFISPNSYLWNKVWKSYWGQLWTQWKQTTTACFIMYLTSLWMRGDESVCKTRITSSPCSDLNSNYLEESNNHRLWLPVLRSLTRNFSHLLTWLSNRASEHIFWI